MQLNVYYVAQIHLIAGAQYVTGRIRRDSVAALQNPKRATLFQLQSQALQTITFST